MYESKRPSVLARNRKAARIANLRALGQAAVSIVAIYAFVWLSYFATF